VLGAFGTAAARDDVMKYELLSGDTVQQDGRTLYRVRRLADGLLGGYVEREDNLAQAGGCFLYDRSRAFAEARVRDNAAVYGVVYDRAVVGDDAKVYGEIFGDARVLGHAAVRGRAYDRAVVKDYAEVYGQAYGDAVVQDRAVVYGQIYGSATASDHEVVYGSKDH
jgi:hypothetical protein